MRRPPYGLCFPCEVLRVIDGDTVVVARRLASGQLSPHRWRIRLLGCWAPERNTPEGREAKAEAERLLAKVEFPSVFIPGPLDAEDILSGTTLGRLLGHVFIDARTTLSEAMVARGMATREKREG